MNHYYWIFLLPVAALAVLVVLAFLNYLSLSAGDAAGDAAAKAVRERRHRKIYAAGAVVGLVAVLGFMFREPLGRLAGTDSQPGTSAVSGQVVQRIIAYPGQWSIPFHPPQGFMGMIIANVPEGTNPRCKMRLVYRDQTVREFESTALARENPGDVASLQYMSLEPYSIEFVVMTLPGR